MFWEKKEPKQTKTSKTNLQKTSPSPNQKTHNPSSNPLKEKAKICFSFITVNLRISLHLKGIPLVEMQLIPVKVSPSLDFHPEVYPLVYPQTENLTW